jgi:hypothetical protein
MQSFLKPINHNRHTNASFNSFNSVSSIKTKQTTLSESLSTLKLKKEKSMTTTTTTTTTSSSKQETDDDDGDALFNKYAKDYENNIEFYMNDDQNTADEEADGKRESKSTFKIELPQLGTACHLLVKPEYRVVHLSPEHKRQVTPMTFRASADSKSRSGWMFRKKNFNKSYDSKEDMTNHIKNHREKIIYLQKMVSHNLIIIPMCIVLTVITGVLLGLSISTPYYEHLDFDIDQLNRSIVAENNLTSYLIESSRSFSNLTAINHTDLANLNSYHFVYKLTHAANKEFYVLTRTKIFKSNRVEQEEFFLYKTNSGIWSSCNSLSSKCRSHVSTWRFRDNYDFFLLPIENSTDKLNISNCKNFLFQNSELSDLQVETSLGPRFLRNLFLSLKTTANNLLIA